MAKMKLYEEEDDQIIARTQLKDPFFQQLTELIFWEINFRKTGKILDLGCGTGRNILAAVKRGFRVTGVDDSAESIRIAKKILAESGHGNKAVFLQRDITKLKKRELGTFDYVILQEVIEHVDDYQKLIDFAYSSLTKGGKILITTPHDPGQWNQFDEYARHVRRFDLGQVRGALGKYTDVRVGTFGFPVHRSVQYLYLILLKLRNKPHEAKTFRKNEIFHAVYYAAGRVLIRLDLLFRFLDLGTTVVAVGVKP